MNSEDQRHVWIVNRSDEIDGLYVFASESRAQEFARRHEHAVVSEEIVMGDCAAAQFSSTHATTIRKRSSTTTIGLPRSIDATASPRTEQRLMSTQPKRDITRFLSALFADSPGDSFIELRVRTARGMRCRFVPTKDVATAAAAIARYAPNTDVYVGVLPRQRRAGNRDGVATRASVLWADCDSAASTRALARFTPPPTIVVASGSGSNRHSYWLLREPVAIDSIELANRRLAGLLSADIACIDAPRIMRPPSSYNHKHIAPTPVRLYLQLLAQMSATGHRWRR